MLFSFLCLFLWMFDFILLGDKTRMHCGLVFILLMGILLVVKALEKGKCVI